MAGTANTFDPNAKIQIPRHVVRAWDRFLIEQNNDGAHQYIEIVNSQDVKGVPPIVSFTIQSDPVSEVGVNGLQAVDMIRYLKCLFQSLNEAFPCRENSLTITKLEEAILWQNERTRYGTLRGVEGKNLP